MRKKANNSVDAAAAEAERKVTFNLSEIGYTDLDGNRIKLNFDQKEFGNLIFSNSQIIEMDDIARALHSTGVAECRWEDAVMIAEIVEQVSFYTHRVKSAIRNYVEKLKK